MTTLRDAEYKLAREIMSDLLVNYDAARRDEGAFPPGDQRAAMSEHRLWHAFNVVRTFLRSPYYKSTH